MQIESVHTLCFTMFCPTPRLSKIANDFVEFAAHQSEVRFAALPLLVDGDPASSRCKVEIVDGDRNYLERLGSDLRAALELIRVEVSE